METTMTNAAKFTFNLRVTVTAERPCSAISEIEDLIRTHSRYYEHWELEDVEKPL